MDPLTAFSLVCNLIQVVDFSSKIVMTCQELRKDGASSTNQEIESMTKHLTDLSTGLNLTDTIESPGAAPLLYHDDQDLLKLAQQCSGTAIELLGELEKLRTAGQQRKRDALRKTFEVWWKRGAIDDIQKRLEQQCRALDTRILINLRRHVHLISIEQGSGFDQLDRKLQSLVMSVARDQITFDELKGLVLVENLSTRQHVSQEFEKHRDQMAADDFYKRVLQSLSFPDIYARQEEIAEAHKQTFEWIFDSGDGTYWISGKAGSGKSTLMNFVCQDLRTEIALRVWSGTDKIFMPMFFFWSPGTNLQKSLTGLLRSLIYQILCKFPDLMPVLSSSMGTAQYGLRQLPTWTEQRLRVTLELLLSDGPEACRLCIFIDGLDEFHGNQDTLLDLVRDLGQTSRVKLCLSSRPETSFRDELGYSAMLKLQDLTDPDIRKYVSDKLERTPLRGSQAPHSSLQLKVTVDKIVQKAEGVFLWVSFLQHFVGEGPKLFEYMDAFITPCVSLYSESTKVVFGVREGNDYSLVDLTLSKQQLSRVLKVLWEQSRDISGKQWITLKPKPWDSFQELEIEKLYEQARRKEAPKGKIIPEQKSSEDKGSCETNNISEILDTDAPDPHIHERPRPLRTHLTMSLANEARRPSGGPQDREPFAVGRQRQGSLSNYRVGTQHGFQFLPSQRPNLPG